MLTSLRKFLALSIFAVIASPALASDLDDEAYFLRLIAALRRPPGFSSAAALQATAAHSAGFSSNPAADDVLRASSKTAGVNTTVSNLHTYSQSGAWLTDTFVSSSINLPGLGTIPLAYARTDTIDSTTLQGFSNSIRSNEFFWGFSRSPSEVCTYGFQMRFLTADVNFEEISQITMAPTRVEANINWGFDCTLGARVALSDNVALGVHGNLGWINVTSEVSNLVPLPNPVPPPQVIPPGTVLATVDDRPRTGLIRAGMAFIPVERISLYLDGEYFQIDSDLAGSLEIGRAILGLEYKHCPHRTVYVGGSLDSESELTVSFGANAAITSRHSLAASYQFNSYPEVKAEYGRFDQVTVSAVIWF